MWKKHNENPKSKQVGDCVVRAISTATGEDWETTFFGLALQGLLMCDMPSSNAVWAAYLKRKGFRRHAISSDCPDCYTVKDFCKDNPKGVFVLGIGTHVVTVIDGNYYDVWDSGNECPVYYFDKEG